MQFDFQRYIQERKRDATAPQEPSRGYAFGRDVKVSRTLARARPVKMALEATHSLGAQRLRDEVLGGATEVGAGDDAWLAEMLQRAVKVLSLSAPPQLLVTDKAGDFGALALSIDAQETVVLDRALLESLDADELAFTMGQQCGHVQNEHTLFLTTDFALEHAADAFLGWIIKPARYAIGAWRRHGDVSADRAGMMVCGDLHVAGRALIKRLAPGSVPGPLDMDAIFEEVEDNPRGSLLADMSQRSPSLVGRLRALKAFAGAEVFRREQGRDGGMSMTSVDRQVESIIKVW